MESYNWRARKILGDIASIFRLSKVDVDGIANIRVELNSDILEVDQFPMNFPKGENPISLVNRKLRSL